MRRLLTLCVAATAALLAGVAFADNKETAQQIANSLRDSGQLTGYQIAVSYQDGTVWLKGHVNSPEQKERAMRLVSQSPAVKQVIGEGLIVTGERSGRTANPLRGTARTAQQVPSSYQGSRATQVAMLQQAPGGNGAAAPAPPMANPPEAVPGPMPGATGAPLPMYATGVGGAPAPVRYDQPALPNYAWPSYASYPNYAALTYPKQYSPTAWPYIGPFYPYPQVPLGWRKVTLEWDDGWWFLDFKDEPCCVWWR